MSEAHIVAMDQLRTAKIAEYLGDFTALAPDDRRRHPRDHRQSAHGRFRFPSGPRIATASPRSKWPTTSVTPGRQQALAASKRFGRAGSTTTAPARFERPTNPAFARCHWVGMRQEPSADARRRKRRERVQHLAACDHHVGARAHGDLGRFDLGDHAATRKLRPDIARHRLDLGR